MNGFQQWLVGWYAAAAHAQWANKGNLPRLFFLIEIIKERWHLKVGHVWTLRGHFCVQSLHSQAVVDSQFGRCGFQWQSCALWNLHECHFTKLLSSFCVSSKNHSAYQKHTWVARTLSHIQTHITQIHSLFSQQLVQWFCIPSSMSEVGGYRRKRQQWGKHKNSWEILHRQVPVQNTTVSLSNSLACA